MADKLPTIDEWATRISQSELPAFGQTLHQVSALDGFILSHAAELTRVILRDPSMTARILKIANSVYFNPTQKKVNTVSRAVVVLGLKTLRSICLATALIDDLVQGDCGPQLAKEVANSFHAALQARAIAHMAGANDSEEVFISSLLHRLGALAFWSVDSKASHVLAKQLNDGKDVVEAERQVLGFSLSDLTKKLAKSWQLSEVLNRPELKASNGLSFDCTDYAWRVVSLQNEKTTEEQWQGFYQELAQFSAEPTEQMREQLDNAVDATKETLRICGAASLVKWVGAVPEEADSEKAPEMNGSNPGAELQLAILRELTQMGQSKADVNLVLQLVLEALHRGAGIQRVIVGLVNPARTEITGKYVVEDPPSNVISHFKFVISAFPALRKALEGAVLWSWRDNDNKEFDQLLKRTGAADAAVAPLIVNKKIIGLFYIDHGENALSSDHVEAFELFTGQATLCLQMLGK